MSYDQENLVKTNAKGIRALRINKAQERGISMATKESSIIQLIEDRIEALDQEGAVSDAKLYEEIKTVITKSKEWAIKAQEVYERKERINWGALSGAAPAKGKGGTRGPKWTEEDKKAEGERVVALLKDKGPMGAIEFKAARETAGLDKRGFDYAKAKGLIKQKGDKRSAVYSAK